MNNNFVTKEPVQTLQVRFSVFEILFAVISEVNFKYGLVVGRGTEVSDALRILIKDMPGCLVNVDNICFRAQMHKRISGAEETVPVDIDSETAGALRHITQHLNDLFNFQEKITDVDVLEIMVARGARQLRQYFKSQYKQLRPYRF